MFLQGLDPVDESRAGDAQFHGAGIVAIDAAHRMRALDVPEVLAGQTWDRIFRAGLDHQRGPVLIVHRAQLFKTLHHVALASLAIGGNDRRMAMQARARLRTLGDAARLFLVQEHVGVTAAVSIVQAKRRSRRTCG